MGNDSLTPTSDSTELALSPAALAAVTVATDSGGVRDLLRHWLDGRDPATIASYRGDLADLATFLRGPSGAPLAPSSPRRSPAQAARAARLAIAALTAVGNAHGATRVNAMVLAYRAHLIERQVAPRTVNRRMSAIRSMLKVARMTGAIDWRIEIENIEVASVKDTRGPGKSAVEAMMRVLVDRARRGETDALRNLAILRLLYDLGLRRGEIESLDLEHWESARRRLLVLGKKRVERAPLDDVPHATTRTLNAWVAARGDEPGPLFFSLDKRTLGHRLTGWSIWNMVTTLAASLDLKVRPHGVRHTAITDVLDQSGGDVRAAQRFSRHKRLDTLQVYDDNRENLGGQLAAKIAAGMPGLDDCPQEAQKGEVEIV
jgi:integrase/recombinase XerC